MDLHQSNMVKENNLEHELKQIFLNSQETTSTHQKNCYKLKKLYEENDFNEFVLLFIRLLHHILLIDFNQRNTYVEKIFEFVASFCFLLKSLDLKNKSIEDDEASDDFQEHPFLDRLFNYLLEASQNIRDVVRFRSCQIINRMLDKLAGTFINEDFCEDIKEILLPRLYDPKNVIRLQGIFSLFRLQDPTHRKDEIIDSFISFTSDPNAKIRQLCIEKVSITRRVIPYIVLRTRDADPNVRLAACKRLSLVSKALKIVQKQEVLKCAMAYNSPKVSEYVSKTLLECWLDQYDKNILSLIKSLRLDADEKDIEDTAMIIEFVLINIFKTKTFNELLDVLSLDEKKLVPLECLNWETVIYWRIFINFLAEHDQFEDALDQVLPELQDLCLYIKKFLSLPPVSDSSFPEFLQQQFIVKNLFVMIKAYDFNDPCRKRLVNALITVILHSIDLTHGTVKEIVDTLTLTIPNNTERRCNFIGELISDILCPINVEEAARLERERECELAKLSVKQNRLMADLETAIAEQRFMEADSLKKELETAKSALSELKSVPIQPQQQMTSKSDSPTLVKCLAIARALLLSPQINELLPSLKTLQKDFIEDLVGHMNVTVKTIAMECYGLCCIIDKRSAEIGIQIFSTPILAYKAGEECDTQILVVCTKAVVDLLRLFGTDLIAEPDENSLSETRHEGHKEIFTGGTSLTDIIQGLSDLMDDEKYELQEVSGQGLCKLIVTKRIYSAAVISKLILKWGSPCSDDQERDKLKQFIGYSLQQIPLLSDSSEQLEGAVLLTINAIVKAPKTSPLADINVDNIVKFMVALCKISPEESQIFTNLAMKICLKMRQKPRSILNPVYSKLLLLLDVPYDRIVVSDLLKLCDQIRDDVRERSVITNITKFVASLTRKQMPHDATKLHSDLTLTTVTAPINEESEEDDVSTVDTTRAVRHTLSTVSLSSNNSVVSRSTVNSTSFNIPNATANMDVSTTEDNVFVPPSSIARSSVVSRNTRRNKDGDETQSTKDVSINEESEEDDVSTVDTTRAVRHTLSTVSLSSNNSVVSRSTVNSTSSIIPNATANMDVSTTEGSVFVSPSSVARSSVVSRNTRRNKDGDETKSTKNVSPKARVKAEYTASPTASVTITISSCSSAEESVDGGGESEDIFSDS